MEGLVQVVESNVHISTPKVLKVIPKAIDNEHFELSIYYEINSTIRKVHFPKLSAKEPVCNFERDLSTTNVNSTLLTQPVKQKGTLALAILPDDETGIRATIHDSALPLTKEEIEEKLGYKIDLID